MDPDSLFLVFEEAVNWADVCLGCLPGACIQVVTPGWQREYATDDDSDSEQGVHEVRLSAAGTVALLTGITGVRLDSCD